MSKEKKQEPNTTFLRADGSVFFRKPLSEVFPEGFREIIKEVRLETDAIAERAKDYPDYQKLVQAEKARLIKTLKKYKTPKRIIS